MLDVLVVGMGPTGATLAGLLGQQGLQVQVVDRLPGLYPLPRAIGLDHEALRIAQQLGVADRLAPHTAPYRPSEYRGMDGQPIKRLDAAPPPWRLGWPPNQVFDQPAFERILRGRLAELPTVQASTGTEVLAVGQAHDHAWADLRPLHPDGRPAAPVQRRRARWLVACDGGASPVRKQLGVALEDLGFDEPWLVVDAIVSEPVLARLPQTQVQYCEAGRPCTYVVGVGRHRRWEIMLNPGDSLATADYPPGQLWPLLARWLAPHEGEIWRAAAYRFHGLVAERWRVGRILLAGDAAHMTPPFMAQGMVQGLRDAQNLAWKLARVLRGGSPDALLDSCATERRPHVLATTRTAMALGRVICERDPDAARARDARLLAEQGGRVRTQYRQDMIPPLQPSALVGDTPGAGTLLPQPWVPAPPSCGQPGPAGTRLRLDELTGCGFRVVAAGPLDAAGRQALRAALAPLAGCLVELVDAPPGGSVPGDKEPAGGSPVGAGPAPALPAPAPAEPATEGLGAWLATAELEPVLAPWLHGLGRALALARPDHVVVHTAVDVAQLLQQLQGLGAALTASAGAGATSAPVAAG